MHKVPMAPSNTTNEKSIREKDYSSPGRESHVLSDATFLEGTEGDLIITGSGASLALARKPRATKGSICPSGRHNQHFSGQDITLPDEPGPVCYVAPSGYVVATCRRFSRRTSTHSVGL